MNLTSQALEVTSFSFGDMPISSISIDDEPWFIAQQVCKALDLTNISRTIHQQLPQHYYKEITSNDPGFSGVLNNLAQVGYIMPGYKDISQIRKLILLNERGLYAVVFRSQAEKARKFADWVYSEVLPTLRKHGTYTMPASSNLALISTLSDSLTELVSHAKEQAKEIDALKNEVTSLRTNVNYFDSQLSQFKAISGTRAGRTPGSRAQYALDYAKFKILDEGIFDDSIPSGDAPPAYVHDVIAKEIRAEFPDHFAYLTDEEVISRHYIAKLLRERNEMLSARLRYTAVRESTGDYSW